MEKGHWNNTLPLETTIPPNAWLAAIVDSSTDAIVSKTLYGIVTSWNAAATRLFGYSAEEMIGQPIIKLAAPGREHEMAQIMVRLRRGERVEPFETQRQAKDGRIIDLSLTVSPIRNADGCIVGASKIARDITERKRQEERLQILAGEVDHRAKNLLAVAQAIVRLTRADTMDAYVSTVERRISALASVHAQIAENRWDGAELGGMIQSGLAIVGADGTRIRCDGPMMLLKPGASQTVAIVVHELAANAVRHGALSNGAGRLEVSWRRNGKDGNLELSWIEIGGPASSLPERQNFGLRVIERNIPDQLGGSVQLDWRPEGLTASVTLPQRHILTR